MDDAWQSQDMAPPANPGTGISIPTHDSALGNGNGAGGGDDQGWSNGGRSPPRSAVEPPPRRSSRSRSPIPRGGDDRPSRGDDRGPGGQNPGNNLHISGLSHRVDTRELEQAFGKIGRVQKAQVMYDPHTRESRGFGFVTMETAEEADAVVTALNATDFMGKTMTVEKARRGRARTPTPGRYYGPPKRNDFERPYDPRPYDTRYSRPDERRRPPRHDDDYRRDYDRGSSYGGRDHDRGSYGGSGGGGGGGGGRDYDRRGGYDDRRY